MKPEPAPIIKKRNAYLFYLETRSGVYIGGPYNTRAEAQRARTLKLEEQRENRMKAK